MVDLLLPEEIAPSLARFVFSWLLAGIQHSTLIMAIYGLCQLTYLLLQEDIRQLKEDLKKENELILGFLSVATAV